MPASLKRIALPALCALALAACWALALAACWSPPDGSRFPGGYETSDYACSNRRDDDGDGLVDCFDPDCLEHSTHCGLIIPLVPQPPHAENDLILCRDRLDNDMNGKFDCGDPSCQAIPETCCGREFDDATCTDGIDNDQNGFVDCADYGCRHGRFVTACAKETACGDGRDNDGDMAIDCADTDCVNLPGPDGMPCPCLGGGAMETTLATCMDGVDNDCNGYADCADFSCSRATDPMVVALCAANAENTLARCMDGVDNDGNGFTDCADFSCARATDPAILAYCASAGAPPSEALDPATMMIDPARCRDGIDNDHNGYADCADNGCSKSTNPLVIAQCFEDMGPDPADPTVAVLIPGRCGDGIDNDGDGSIDCDDFDCAENPAIVGLATHGCPAGAFCHGE